MNANNLIDIRKKLQIILDEKRYEHTLGVTYTAAALAMRYNGSVYQAQLAGLLHDCAKCLSLENMVSICKKNHLSVTELEKTKASLLHSKVGSFLAEQDYQVSDQDVLNAILYHTTGRPGMSLLEKIIFVADYIEPGRSSAPNLPEIRKTAFVNLDQALLRILEDTLTYLKERGGEIDRMTADTFAYYDRETDETK